MNGLAIRVRGQVQGVGFRPFIWHLARAHGLHGEVLNDAEGVLIRVAGAELEKFIKAIRAEAPPLARVDDIEAEPFFFTVPPNGFQIAASEGVGAETRVTPDAATCTACLVDVHGDDPRRAGYVFTNCTHCGPRFTIIAGLPYDRARTSMAGFLMCAACRAEYEDPADRRFHAQPVACADCGPRLWLEEQGRALAGDPLALAVERLAQGAILAVKGLGGFHLCCDATNEDAVATLRLRKHRPVKPLALMDQPDRISAYARMSSKEAARLVDPAAPIVLLKKSGNVLPEALAPGMDRLGVMLPYTPLHHLLTERMARPLVMTSANVSGEPQVIANEEAREKLSGIVDAFLMHDRDILRRLDDSVELVGPGGPMILRHARGRVPDTLPLPEGFEDAPQCVAFGGQLKSSICLAKNGQALLSHHLGDLDDVLTWEEFLNADTDYAELFDHRPDVFACDLHDGYQSSQHAAVRASGTPERVQHHHAHITSCMAENGWPLNAGKVAGIVLDGLGLGTDGTIWGGEVLLCDYRGFERIASLDPVPLVGGEAAQREPWRTAAMRLDKAGLAEVAERVFSDHPLMLIRQAAQARLNAVPSSSVGRLFDAFAAVIGLANTSQSFEGEAAMQLEALARQWSGGRLEGYSIGITDDKSARQNGSQVLQREEEYSQTCSVLNDANLWQTAVADIDKGVDIAAMAWRFHLALADGFAQPARQLVESGAAETVALSGGCFQNALLLELVLEALDGVPVLIHNKVPANDGGLALGQAVTTLARHL